MIRSGLIVLALCALAACGPPNPDDDPSGTPHIRQMPSNTEPGVHISGYANVGVVKRF